MAEVIAPSPNPPPLTRVVWPTALVVGVIVLMILLNLLMTVEMTMFAHSPNFRLPQLTIVIWPSIVTMIMWLLVEVRSTRYLEPSSERPVRWVFHHMRRLPLLIIAFIAITYGLRYLSGYRLNFVIWLVGAMYESLKVTLLYCCWLALMFGVVSFARMRQQTEHLLNAQKTLVEAKLTQLKAQLRPHFLFNTLNTISALMQVDVARADRLVTLLGDLLRANLNASERNVVPLEEELQLLRQYAEIMQERFVGRVTVEWEVDSNALRASVPTMVLQPLLENAFKHGVERNAGSEHIRVVVHYSADVLQIAIHNTGSTLSQTYQDGWGLRNCRERLRLLYGAAASLTLNNADSGVVASMTLPWTEIA